MALVRDLWRARSWRDRSFYLVGPPGWRPDHEGATPDGLRSPVGWAKAHGAERVVGTDRRSPLPTLSDPLPLPPGRTPSKPRPPPRRAPAAPSPTSPPPPPPPLCTPPTR